MRLSIVTFGPTGEDVSQVDHLAGRVGLGDDGGVALLPPARQRLLHLAAQRLLHLFGCRHVHRSWVSQAPRRGLLLVRRPPGP